MKQVTQKDIARRLSVSQGLVAGVLSGRRDARASEETRRRIVTAAHEMGYHPHQAARALRQGRTQTVALVVLRADNEFRPLMALLIQGLSEQLSAFGYSLTVRVHEEQITLLAALESLAAGRSCDAVALFSPQAAIEEQARFLEKRHLPFIVKGRFEREHPNWLQVDFDHEGMMAASVEALKAHDRTRTVYIGFTHFETFAERLEEAFLLRVPEPVAVFRHWAHEETVQAVSDLFDAPPELRPDSFVVGSGSGTWFAIEEALLRRGIQIGFGNEDVMVVGVAAGELYPLRVGKGLAFGDDDLRFDRIGKAMARQLQAALCHDGQTQPFVRILPPLNPTPPHWDEFLRETLLNCLNQRKPKE